MNNLMENKKPQMTYRSNVTTFSLLIFSKNLILSGLRLAITEVKEELVLQEPMLFTVNLLPMQNKLQLQQPPLPIFKEYTLQLLISKKTVFLRNSKKTEKLIDCNNNKINSYSQHIEEALLDLTHLWSQASLNFKNSLLQAALMF